jgi:flagellar basal-body rod modification protein FlgD
MDVHVTGLPTAAPDRVILHLAPRGPRPAPGRAAWSLTMQAAGTVDARVYDARGRLVRALPTVGGVASGAMELEWNGRDRTGRPVPAGVYVLRVVTPRGSASDRVVLVR